MRKIYVSAVVLVFIFLLSGCITQTGSILQVQAIELGGFGSSSVITTDNRVFTWGSNGSGSLGNNTTNSQRTPTEITHQFELNSGETIVKMHMASGRSAALSSEGRMFIWGDNKDGHLGDGTTINRIKPMDITDRFNLGTSETIESIGLSWTHAGALTSEGRLFTWGSNSNGQLGDNTNTDRMFPLDITSRFNLQPDEIITAINFSESYHASAITSKGRVFMWGANRNGQLGDNSLNNRWVPKDITEFFNLQTETDETIEQISLGFLHSAALTSNGRVLTWGMNHMGQLGDGSSTTRRVPTDITRQFNLLPNETIISVQLASTHSSALTSTGRLFMWGLNFDGQLGNNSNNNSSSPVDITPRFNFSDGEKIILVSMGSNHSSALTSKNRLFLWGSNTFGELGDQTRNNRQVPFDLTDRIRARN